MREHAPVVLNVHLVELDRRQVVLLVGLLARVSILAGAIPFVTSPSLPVVGDNWLAFA